MLQLALRFSRTALLDQDLGFRLALFTNLIYVFLKLALKLGIR